MTLQFVELDTADGVIAVNMSFVRFIRPHGKNIDLVFADGIILAVEYAKASSLLRYLGKTMEPKAESSFHPSLATSGSAK